MVKFSSGMGLIHSFCMTESNKINVLNQKKKKQTNKKPNKKTEKPPKKEEMHKFLKNLLLCWRM